MDRENDVDSTDYLATPTQGRGAGILVLHSGRGLTQFITQFCRRLAREGFVPLAPDLFDGETPETPESARAIKQQVDTEKVRRELEDTAEFLRQYESVSRSRIGVIGIGYGGEWACRMAPIISDICSGIVLFYGYEEADWESVDAPVLGHFAQLDHAIPESRVNELRHRFQDANVPHDFFIYQNTEPSFFETDSTARHDPNAAKLAWERTRAHLHRNII